MGIYRTQKLKHAKAQLEKEVAIRTFQLRQEKEKVENSNIRITQQSNELASERDKVFYINEMLENKNREQTQTSAEVLTLLDIKLIQALNIKANGTAAKDGMDIALCKIDFTKKTLKFSGAKRPLYFLKKQENPEIEIIPGDRIGIGEKSSNNNNYDFKDHFVPLKTGDRVYIFSDGYIDQFGGEKNKKFLGKQFRDIIMELISTPMTDQRQVFSTTIDKWKGTNNEQTDDILVIGIEI